MNMIRRFAARFARFKMAAQLSEYAATSAIGQMLCEEMDQLQAANYLEVVFV